MNNHVKQENNKKFKYNILLFLLIVTILFIAKEAVAQNDTIVYHLTINQKKVTIAGKTSTGMTINGSIPGPTLRFTEGDYAVMYVKNEMEVETSVHWHGLLVPNFFDGVPYLTTPPIQPGKTQRYEFPLKQAGTYWYHSHTALQEQSGVYGSIVIDSKAETQHYDTDLVLVLSDWTYEKPKHVLKTLKRGLEWYDIKKGTSVPLNRVIARGALRAQLNFWRQRMEGADIADIYYPAFLTNGKPVQEYPQFKPGEKLRVRFINAAASSQFWLTFGGEDPLLVAADGLDVVPVKRNKTFIAVAETYDFVVTLPQNGKIEIKAFVQDGSGQTAAYLGQGPVIKAPAVPRPDKIAMMQQMAGIKMKMGAPASKFNPDKVDPHAMMNKWGMQMEHQMEMDHMESMDHSQMNDGKMPEQEVKEATPASGDTVSATEMDHAKMDHPMKNKQTGEKPGMNIHEKMNAAEDSVSSGKMDHSYMGDHMPGMQMSDSNKAQGMPMKEMGTDKSMNMLGMKGMQLFAEYNYNYLQSPEKTDFSDNKPVREILLNLTGNMVRYIWSLNGVPLSETDQIKVNQGQVMRITLNNLTMMHHPMHLHGHFFRVINEHGEYSPLKHTVNVAPMQKVVIEFDANEYGDWFFHCHILYHLDAGMARIFSYGTPRDEKLKAHPVSKLTNISNHFFTWGVADLASHMTELNLVSSNIRNQFVLRAEYGWNKNIEAEFTYGRYLYDYLSVFGGVNVENRKENSMDEVVTTAIAGVRYLTPYLFNLDARIDSKLRPQISINREILILPRTFLFGEYEYQVDFGWIGETAENTLPGKKGYRQEVTWNIGLEYFLSKNFTVTASYDNRFGAGGGLSARF